MLSFDMLPVGVDFLVYCSKCGFKNKDDAVNCAECEAPLQMPRSERRGGRRVEDECFGLPHGGAIVGLIIGIIIIIVGLSLVPGIIPPETREATEPYFWAIIVIVFGVLLIAGALYRFSRR